MQIEVVVNCGAGSIEGDEADAQRDQIEAAFAACGATARVGLVAGAALESAARAAIERGADVLVMAGGDGTLGTAAGAVAEAKVTLGVLPLGTFNHFAKDLGIPLGLEDAARVVVEGDTVPVDLAEVNERPFVNNSSIGLYPVMVDLRDEIRSARGWGKVRAVPVAAWRVLRRFPTRRLHIDAGEERWDLRTPFVFIGNNSYEVGPAGMGARSQLDGGVLCCYVARAESRMRFVRMAVQAVARGSAAAPELESVCTGDLVVGVHGHRVLVSLDGEITTLRAPLEYRSRPGALRVRVPARGTADDPGGRDAESGVEADRERS